MKENAQTAINYEQDLRDVLTVFYISCEDNIYTANKLKAVSSKVTDAEKEAIGKRIIEHEQKVFMLLHMALRYSEISRKLFPEYVPTLNQYQNYMESFFKTDTTQTPSVNMQIAKELTDTFSREEVLQLRARLTERELKRCKYE